MHIDRHRSASTPTPIRKQQRGRLRRWVPASLCLVIAATATGTAVAAPAPPPAPAPACAAPAAGVPGNKQWPAPPPMSIDPRSTYTASLGTNCGTITVSLNAAKAPQTVNSFVFLSGQRYFDHTPCHRLTTDGIFVLQCGDPTGSGTGGPGYTFGDENLAGATYPAGTVAMANSGPNSDGSQFFLVYKDSPLPPKYTPFGKITGGLDVLRKVAAGGTKDQSGDGAPATGIVLGPVTTARR